MARVQAAMVCAFLAGCSGIAEPSRDVEAALQTDRLSYSFEREAGFYTTGPIQVVVTNTSEAAAYLTRGTSRLELVLEGLEDGEWVTKYAKNIPDGGGPPLRLGPGESATFVTTIEGFRPGECECSPILAFPDGVYRFRIFQGYVERFDAATLQGEGELAEEFRVSNRFAVDAP